MLIIDQNQTRVALGMAGAISVVEQAYRDFAQGGLQPLPRTSAELSDQGEALIILPAIHRAKGYYGFKYAGSFPHNPQKGLPTVMSQIMLYSLDSGQPLAVLDGGYLTALKTGASVAAATKYLSTPQARMVAMLGAGLQAGYLLKAINLVRELSEVRVFDIIPEQSARFVSQLRPDLPEGCCITASPTAAQAVSGADIICTCTTSLRPVIAADWVKPGCHINAIGSFTPQMQEIGPDLILRSNQVICDQMDETWRMSGDLVIPHKQGLFDQGVLTAELGDVVAGKAVGRERPQDITLFESVGFGALDLAVAIAVYEELK